MSNTQNTNSTSNTGSATTIITGSRTRLSFPHLFEPESFDDGKAKYSVSLIIPKDDRRTLDLIHSAIRAAYEAGAFKLRGTDRNVPALESINLPLHDGDRKHPDDPAYANSYYLNAKNQDQPRMFGMDGEEDVTRQDIYAGCYARCKLQFYCYNRSGNKGIAVSLLGLRKSADGKPLGGSVCTADDFNDEEDDFLS